MGSVPVVVVLPFSQLVREPRIFEIDRSIKLVKISTLRAFNLAI